jgi:hypothetical protein
MASTLKSFLRRCGFSSLNRGYAAAHNEGGCPSCRQLRNVGFFTALETQCSEAMHILDRRLAARVLLLQGVIYFLFPPFIPVENSFCDFALLCFKHEYPFVATTADL